MTTDVIIIGAGHNGLVCANYLAMTGLKVQILERLNVVGGAAVTEEFHPGFKNSVAAYTVSLLNPKIIKDLDLHRHGLQILERKLNNFWPHHNNDCLAFPLTQEQLKTEIARFSKHDADALTRYQQDIGMAADLIRAYLLKSPPNIEGSLKDFFAAANLGRSFHQLSLHEKRVISNLFSKSVADFLNEYFENDFVKGAFAWDGIVGNYASPYTPGSAYVLLHHAFGETNGKKGIWGHARGGMGAITQAMAKSALEKGVIINTDTSVKQVLVKNQRVTGVLLTNGMEIPAKRVVSSLNPQLLFTKMVDSQYLPTDFQLAIKNYKNHSGSFRINLALDRLPQFSCLSHFNKNKAANYLTAGIVIGPTIDYLKQAYLDAENHGWSRKPVIEMLIPSTLDQSLAPKQQHVASLFCQQFNKNMDWEKHSAQAINTILTTLEQYAPDLSNHIVAIQSLSPSDLENRFSLIGGDIFHGALSLDQLFCTRPIIAYANYRSPIVGLYMCGAGTHPGGGVTGAPGHNAAMEIIKDKKSWRNFEKAFRRAIPKQLE